MKKSEMKTEIIDAIQSVLTNDLSNANMAAFHPQARLNEDLYLDSVLVLQLLISLELKLSIEVPDDALNDEDFATVDSLSEFLLSKLTTETDEISPQDIAVSDDVAEEFEDIKVHCFVSCLCQCIKDDNRLDHRPFYFGVWDADVVITDNFSIGYHAETLNHDFFRDWYQKLYGISVNPWYKSSLSKKDNISALLNLLEHKTDSQNIMVMLDMFRLPERENKFNQNPFPHYVMLENSKDPEKLFMSDPDFRWEGDQNKQQILHAIESEAVAGGYLFDSTDIKPTSNQAIHDYFIACLNTHSNPMTNAVRTIVNTHLQQGNNLSPANLTEALMQLPVLAIRKYAYEHGLAFFMLQLNLDFDEFESWCDVIETLVSTYKKIQFRAMKIANMANEDINISSSNNSASQSVITELSTEITQLLEEQDKREFEIKHRLQSLFEQWWQQVNLTQKQSIKEVCT